MPGDQTLRDCQDTSQGLRRGHLNGQPFPPDCMAQFAGNRLAMLQREAWAYGWRTIGFVAPQRGPTIEEMDHDAIRQNVIRAKFDGVGCASGQRSGEGKLLGYLGHG